MSLKQRTFQFFHSPTSGGVLLVVATVLALIFANTSLSTLYHNFLNIPFSISIASLGIHKPLILWINDGLMALFFFMVGLELKRELIEGELNSLKKVLLPAIAALGGMVVPAIIFLFFNAGNPVALRGWAIPTATDIAFALGILALVSTRVPISLKVFLTTLAIFDDMGAVLIIALFYTSKISWLALSVVLFCSLFLFFVHKAKVNSILPYLILGMILWVAMLKSGVHATIAGVLLATFIPITTQNGRSLLSLAEKNLHGWVTFVILPLFAFANAGLNFRTMNPSELLGGVPLGIALGLFLGKQIGVFGFTWISVKLKICSLPAQMNWFNLYGTSLLCGIGFTMSLFIGSLAYPAENNYPFDERLGILTGSFLSGIFGFWVLRKALKKPVIDPS